jgi:hypothetical protein
MNLTRSFTKQDKEDLGKLCTKNENGFHFTEVFDMDWLFEMEEMGWIKIHKPVHPTGIPYSPEYWSVEVLQEVVEWFDQYGELT